MESLVPSAKDHSTDVMVKYLVLGIILILLFFAIQYIFKTQIGMIEGLTGRGDKNKTGGSGGPLDDENEGDIITIAKRQQEMADKTQKSLNMDEH